MHMCSLVISMATSAQTFVALCLVMGTIVCGRPQRRQSDCANVRQKGISTVDLVCRSLWYIDEAMKHCSENGPCNHEALKEMKSGIQSTLCEWVSRVLHCIRAILHVLHSVSARS